MRHSFSADSSGSFQHDCPSIQQKRDQARRRAAVHLGRGYSVQSGAVMQIGHVVIPRGAPLQGHGLVAGALFRGANLSHLLRVALEQGGMRVRRVKQFDVVIGRRAGVLLLLHGNPDDGGRGELVVRQQQIRHLGRQLGTGGDAVDLRGEDGRPRSGRMPGHGGGMRGIGVHVEDYQMAMVDGDQMVRSAGNAIRPYKLVLENVFQIFDALVVPGGGDADHSAPVLQLHGVFVQTGAFAVLDFGALAHGLNRGPKSVDDGEVVLGIRVQLGRGPAAGQASENLVDVLLVGGPRV